MTLGLAMVCLLIWLVILFGRGGFWRCQERDTQWSLSLPEGSLWPVIGVVVPARDEAPVIERSIGSLLEQDYPGSMRIVLVDDASRDGTGALAEAVTHQQGRTGSLSVIRNEQLPVGWTGKLWAMATGLKAMNGDTEPPDFVLFCDADIALAPDTLRALVVKAATERRVLVSLMAKLAVETVAEKALIPAFVYFFAKLYPFAWVSDPKSPVAAAAGGCMLVDRQALVRAMGFEAIRGSIIDDCALGRMMKQEGPITLALTNRAVSLRGYADVGSIRKMITRSAYAELKFSPIRLVLAIAGLTLTYFVPVFLALLAGGVPGLIGLAVCLAMILSFVPILRFYGLPLALAVTVPVVAVVYCIFTVESALLFWRGKGGEWKGRYQASPNTDQRA